MLEGLNWILFPLTAVVCGFVGSVLSFWVWSRPFAEETVEADRRAVIGRWLVVASACAAWCELVTGAYLADWAARMFRMDTAHAWHVVVLIQFSTSVALLVAARYVVHRNPTWAGRRVRIASTILFVISGLGGVLFLATEYWQ